MKRERADMKIIEFITLKTLMFKIYISKSIKICCAYGYNDMSVITLVMKKPYFREEEIHY